MITIHRRVGVLAATAALALLSACTTPAPMYTASVENAENLKKLAATSVGEFQLAMSGSGATSISLRADSMVSPVGGNYAAYLAEALRTELSLAGKLDPKSPFEITGSLLKNDIAAGGFSLEISLSLGCGSECSDRELDDDCLDHARIGGRVADSTDSPAARSDPVGADSVSVIRAVNLLIGEPHYGRSRLALPPVSFSHRATATST